MGGVVLVVAALFLFFAYSTSQVRAVQGYEVSAQFDSVSGIHDGSDVRIGGVKVGTVTQESIDPKDYRAVLTMILGRNVRLPADSKAVVASAGLLGGKYVKLEPGRSSTPLEAGGQITNTEGAVVLEELLGKIIFLATDQGQDQGRQDQGQGGASGQGDGAAPK